MRKKLDEMVEAKSSELKSMVHHFYLFCIQILLFNIYIFQIFDFDKI